MRRGCLRAPGGTLLEGQGELFDRAAVSDSSLITLRSMLVQSGTQDGQSVALE